MPTYQEWLNMSKEDLIKGFNDNNTTNADFRNMATAQLYRDELMRRDQEEINKAMLDYTQRVERFTKQMRNMTWIILVANIVGVFFTVLGFFWDAN